MMNRVTGVSIAFRLIRPLGLMTLTANLWSKKLVSIAFRLIRPLGQDSGVNSLYRLAAESPLPFG